MARAVVVGAGVGGLATAIRLRALGHDVTVFERNEAGGKLATSEDRGFRFDTGPSLLTIPFVFDELFALTGRSIDDYVNVISIEQPFEYRFSDSSSLRTHDDAEATYDAFEELYPGGGDEWLAFFARGKRIWEISERTFFAGPMDSWRDLLRRMKSPRDLIDIDALMALAGRSEQTFTDSRARQWANRYATYSGSNPWAAPATLACIPYIEQQFGCWHVEGGLGGLAKALLTLCAEIGVEVRDETPVLGIETAGNAASGVRLASGVERSEIVVSDVNASVLYETLLPDPARAARIAKAQRSSSVLSMNLGLAGKTEGGTHHTVWFANDQREEFLTIFGDNSVARDCTIYACNPSLTDPTMAPEGNEAWTVLVNVGEGAETDWQGLAASIIERMGVAGRVMHASITTPKDLEERFGDPGGSIYGTSSNGLRSAFLRASNRGPVRGMYLVGGSAHPGGGLPLVAISGQIVASMVRSDFRS